MTSRRPMTFRERGIFLAAALLGAGLAGDRFFLRPALERRDELEQRIALAERRYLRDRALLARKERLLEERRAYALAAGPRESSAEEGTELLREIERRARANGVSIRDIKSRPASDRSGGQGPSVAIVAESAWDPFARFLHDLHRSPRFLQVDKAVLQTKGDGTSRVLTTQLVVSRSRSMASTSKE